MTYNLRQRILFVDFISQLFRGNDGIRRQIPTNENRLKETRELSLSIDIRRIFHRLFPTSEACSPRCYIEPQRRSPRSFGKASTIEKIPDYLKNGGIKRRTWICCCTQKRAWALFEINAINSLSLSLSLHWSEDSFESRRTLRKKEGREMFPRDTLVVVFCRTTLAKHR